MKAPAYVVASLAALLFLTACSSDVEDTYETADLKINTAPYQYSSFESEILNLVNEHRTSVGLNPLQRMDVISSIAMEQTDHMISFNEVCHDYFMQRKEKLSNFASGKNVAENVAYGFETAQGVVNAWVKSDAHRKAMEGEATHFGISVKRDTKGKNYFTNIFMSK